MPYSIRKMGMEYCVFNKMDGKKMGCSPSMKKAREHMMAIYANEGKKAYLITASKSEDEEEVWDGVVEDKASPPRTNPDDWADVPDPKESSKWNLYIGDADHIAGAITALQPGGYRGNEVQLGTPRTKVIARIRAAINHLAKGDQKDHLLERLSAVKSLDEPAQEKTIQRYEQMEVNYTPLSLKLNEGQACANCRWFDGSTPSCLIIKNYPQDILSTGYCDEWNGTASMGMMPDREMPGEDQAEPAEEPHDMMSMERHDHETPEIGYIAPDSNADSVFKTLIGKFQRGLKPGDTVFKGADGARYMLIVTSNSYQDRDRETITTNALQNYVDTCWKSVEDRFYTNNPLMYWHDDRVVIGDIVWADVRGPFLVELAKENNAPLSAPVFDYREQHPDEKWGASHRFAYLKAHKEADGTFHAIQKRETSILPRDAAANVLTFSGVIPMPSKRDDYLNKMLGLENAAELLDKGIDVLVAELQKRGIDHKSSEKPAESAGQFDHLLVDMISAQADMAGTLDQVGADLKAVQAELTAAKAANAKLETANQALTDRVDVAEKALNARPRLASKDAQTEINPEILPEEVKDSLIEKDAFWKLPVRKA